MMYSVKVIPKALESSINFFLIGAGILRVRATWSPVGSLGGRPTLRFMKALFLRVMWVSATDDEQCQDTGKSRKQQNE